MPMSSGLLWLIKVVSEENWVLLYHVWKLCLEIKSWVCCKCLKIKIHGDTPPTQQLPVHEAPSGLSAYTLTADSSWHFRKHLSQIMCVVPVSVKKTKEEVLLQAMWASSLSQCVETVEKLTISFFCMIFCSLPVYVVLRVVPHPRVLNGK